MSYLDEMSTQVSRLGQAQEALKRLSRAAGTLGLDVLAEELQFQAKYIHDATEEVHAIHIRQFNAEYDRSINATGNMVKACLAGIGLEAEEAE